MSTKILLKRREDGLWDMIKQEEGQEVNRPTVFSSRELGSIMSAMAGIGMNCTTIRVEFLEKGEDADGQY